MRPRPAPPLADRKVARLSPQKARTELEVLALERDNWDGRTHWFIVDGYEVTLAAQKPGESPTGKVTIPKSVFDRMIAWYTTPQRVSKGRRRATA